MSQLREWSHAGLAVIAAVLALVAGSATVIADVINQFGGHVSGTDVTAKTTLVSAAVLLFSKLIDSANDAWIKANQPPATSVPPPIA